MLEIRAAKEEDVPALVAIYDHYVKHTAVTFEYETPSVTEFAQRLTTVTGQNLPYLVAHHDGHILGYSYAAPFSERMAYRPSVELTIYLDPKTRRHGVGRALYQKVTQELTALGYENLYACIATPVVAPIADNDKYLALALSQESTNPFISWDSVRFHHHMGFRMVGLFSQCGFKFEQFFDMVFMERFVGPHQGTPKVYLKESMP